MGQLTKQLMCICLRNNVQIWIEKQRVEKLQEILLNSTDKGFFELDGRMINLADMVGIFTPQDMEELTRRKNGEWLCKYNEWHQKFTKCECAFRIEAENQGFCTSCYVRPCVC